MKYFISIIIAFTIIGCSSSNSVSKESSTTTPPQPQVEQADLKPPASPNI